MSQIRQAPGWRIRAGALLVAVVIGDRAVATEICAPEPQGEGRIAAVIDARTIRLDDGRIVRLAGLAMLAETRSATDLLSKRVGETVSLHSENEAPDRYGRQHAVVFPAGSQTSLQIALVAAGAAVYDGVLDAPGCRAEFAAAEASARNSRNGIWSASTPLALSAEIPGDILARIGQFVLVEGQVRSVRQVGGTNYLNFGRRWTQGFTVTIPNRSVASFEAAGVSLRSLEGRRIRVRGIVDARTAPRIEASRPAQIEWAGADALATAVGTRD